MGLFKNNRKTYITNMDNMIIYNRDTKKYILDFDEKQKEVLDTFLKYNLPIECIAYTEVPCEVMEAARRAFWANPKLPPLGIWKIIHTSVNAFTQILMIEAYTYGVSIVDEFSSFDGYNIKAFGLIGHLAQKNINACSLLTKDMSYSKFSKRVQSVYGSDIISGFYEGRFE